MAALIRICLSSAFFPNSPTSFTRLSSLPAPPTRRNWLALSVRANNDASVQFKWQGLLIKMKPKPELRAVIGEDMIYINRMDAANKIKDYISKHGLKKTNESVAICDEKLKKLFGKERVNMSDIEDLLIPHLEK